MFAIIALISLFGGLFFAVMLAHDITHRFHHRQAISDIVIDLALMLAIACILVASAHDALGAIYPPVVCGITGF